MKSPCYLVTLSLESSDFQTFLKQYVILVPFGALILHLVDTGRFGVILHFDDIWDLIMIIVTKIRVIKKKINKLCISHA